MIQIQLPTNLDHVPPEVNYVPLLFPPENLSPLYVNTSNTLVLHNFTIPSFNHFNHPLSLHPTIIAYLLSLSSLNPLPAHCHSIQPAVNPHYFSMQSSSPAHYPSIQQSLHPHNLSEHHIHLHIISPFNHQQTDRGGWMKGQRARGQYLSIQQFLTPHCLSIQPFLHFNQTSDDPSILPFHSAPTYLLTIPSFSLSYELGYYTSIQPAWSTHHPSIHPILLLCIVASHPPSSS